LRCLPSKAGNRISPVVTVLWPAGRPARRGRLGPSISAPTRTAAVQKSEKRRSLIPV